jgi:hypothetical protein
MSCSLYGLTWEEKMEKAHEIGRMKLCYFVTIVTFACLSWFLMSSNDVDAGTIYYVAPNGSDSNSGSVSNPWATIEQAARKSGPGDTIMVRRGVYSAEAWLRGRHGMGGARGKLWTLRAYPGEEVILKKRIIVDAPYVRIQDLHFDTAGIQITNWDGSYAHHVEILNNRFVGLFVYGAIFVDGSDCLIEGNVLELSSTGSTLDHGIYVAAGDSFIGINNIIRNNYISGPTGYGIHIYDEAKRHGDPIKTIANIIVENNFIKKSQKRAGILVAAGPGTRIDKVIIRNNVLVDNAAYGIGTYYNGSGVRDIRIFNNTVYKSGLASIGIGSDITGVVIKNNIIDNTNSEAKYHIDCFGNNPNVIVDHNLYWPPTTKLKNVTDSHPLTGDPKFVSPINENFHLSPGSAAIGKALALEEVRTDKDGLSRPQGGGYDIGAYEYSGDATQHPIPN